jgi:hypothetical protein
VVDNKQNEPAATGISRDGEIPRDFESQLIWIPADLGAVDCWRSARCRNRRCAGRGRLQQAPSLDKGADEVVNALAINPKLELTGIFAGAVNDDLLFVVGKT